MTEHRNELNPRIEPRPDPIEVVRAKWREIEAIGGDRYRWDGRMMVPREEKRP